ncbi:MAG: hypothetical protein ACLPYS_11500 [Vulcanimicrobiaceae bacterium]
MNMRSLGKVIWTRRYLVGGFIVLVLLCLPFVAPLLKPTYVAVSELSYVGSGSAGNTNSLTNAILPTTDLPDLVMSSDVVSEATRKVDLDKSVDETRLMMSVKSSPHSNVVPISVHMKDQVLALSLANALADSAVDQYKVIAARQYDEIIAHLQLQMNAERAEIRSNDAKLQRSLQTDYAVGATDSLDNISKHLDDLESQRATAYATYVADQAAMSVEGGGSGADRAGLQSAIHEQILANDPTYQAVKALQSKDSATLVGEKAGYTSAFRGLAGLEEQVDDETQAVARAQQAAIRDHPGDSSTYAQVVLNEHNAAALAAGDKARLDAIDGEISAATRGLADLPKVGVSANMFRLQRDSASAAYQALLTRYQQTLADRVQATALGAAFVLDHAQAAYPRIPPVLMALVVTLLIFALAIGIALLAEALDPRVRSATEIEDLYGAPRIGSV